MTAQTTVQEPTASSLAHPLLHYSAATRPPFLMATLVACLLGLASAAYSGVSLDLKLAVAAIQLTIAAMLTHGILLAVLLMWNHP